MRNFGRNAFKIIGKDKVNENINSVFVTDDVLKNFSLFDTQFKQIKDLKHVIFAVSDYAKFENKMLGLIEYISKNMPTLSQNVNFAITYSVAPYFSEVEENSLIKLNEVLLTNLSKEFVFPVMDLVNINIPQITIDNPYSFALGLSTSKVLRETVKDIEKHSFSPLERAVAIYMHATNFTYKNEKLFQPTRTSRALIDVLHGDKIVCVGFQAIQKILNEALGIPTMAEYAVLQVENGIVPQEDVFESHAYNYMLIKDSKYGLNKVFLTDPTTDSIINVKENLKTFLGFALPVNKGIYRTSGAISQVFGNELSNLSSETVISLSRMLWYNGFTNLKLADEIDLQSLFNKTDYDIKENLIEEYKNSIIFSETDAQNIIKRVVKNQEFKLEIEKNNLLKNNYKAINNFKKLANSEQQISFEMFKTALSEVLSKTKGLSGKELNNVVEFIASGNAFIYSTTTKKEIAPMFSDKNAQNSAKMFIENLKQNREYIKALYEKHFPPKQELDINKLTNVKIEDGKLVVDEMILNRVKAL